MVGTGRGGGLPLTVTRFLVSHELVEFSQDLRLDTKRDYK